MRLVQLRTFTGVPGEGEPVFVAPDNVGMVAPAMSDPPVTEVWLKVGTPMLMVEGSAEDVAARISAASSPVAEAGTARVFGGMKISPAQDHAELIEEIEKFGMRGDDRPTEILVSLLRDAVFHLMTRLGPPQA